ncbi:3'(2'),5'-bisphosphate nucleotidase CysQ family protein [Rubrivirga marina]|uniref:3'(2'),5'-bisphosphate nucleotidase CysQ n=1 Tax=Rubrivirga marina TaxID=1196024 RepID=A0A271IXU4_9BACT|nr:inositol monophosphatase family protein [Rubrivirga marina]PAP75950.1 hypothetical protein BSZ37_05600 [Rubrivirga marina]
MTDRRPGPPVELVRRLATAGGAIALAHYGHAAPLGDDALAAARAAAEAYLRDRLARLPPGVPVVSADAVQERHESAHQWWCVDPLGGSAEFLQRTGAFTVDVALIERGRPVLGVVVAPAWGRAYAAARGRGAHRVDGDGPPVPIRIRHADPRRLTVAVGSSSERPPAADLALRLYMGGVRVTSRRAGSSLPFCLVAEGAADLAPRAAQTPAWGMAAAQAILEAAGGRLTDLAGRPLAYSMSAPSAPAIVGSGDPDLDWHQYVSAPVQATSLAPPPPVWAA